jgi:hypothetical protein
MVQIDKKLLLGSSTIEMHVGNGSGTSGTNPASPNEAPNVHPRSATPAASDKARLGARSEIISVISRFFLRNLPKMRKDMGRGIY